MGSSVSRAEVLAQANYFPIAPFRSYELDRRPGPTTLQGRDYFEFIVNGVTKRKLKIISKLGQGGIGSVFLAEDVTVERKKEKPFKYALKIIEDNRVQLIQESLQTARQIGSYCEQLAKVLEDYFYPAENDYEKDRLYVVLVFNIRLINVLEIL
jgi:serine/threonine protein kinase